MKVNELLRRLENIKIDEDERREIAEYLAQKLSDDGSLHTFRSCIITKDKKIYYISTYEKLLKAGGISLDDAYVYVFARDIYYLADYYFPFLTPVSNDYLAYAYLSKLGFEVGFHHVVPATGLKYVAIYVYLSRNIKHAVVEVADIDTAAINMNLPMLIRGILGTKHIDDHKVKDIVSQLRSRKLFDGYNFDEALRILDRYYDDHDTSLAKDVKAIKDAYDRIFRPYRLVYDLNTK